MDRNQRSRRQKSANGSYAQQSRRSMGSRLGLEKRNAPRPKAPPEKAAPTPHAPPRQRPAQEINPQKAGYRPGTPRRTRRVTQAEIIRAKRRRRLLGALGVLAVLAVGAFVSINLLFKVTIFRVESYDRSQPVDTGIYTSDELIEALGIEKNSNLFAFSTAEKTQQLALQFPYLEHVAVEIQLPAAVIIKVEPATERFACMYPGGWMVLSDSLKILRTDVSQPDGLILLTMSLPTDFSPVVGQNIEPKSYNSLLSETQQATAETAGLQASALQTLTEVRDGLQENNLFDGTTALNIQDLSDIEFTYQNRVQVLLGSETNLAYKLRLAAAALTDPEKGLAAGDKGVLDISTQRSDGDIRAYFDPDIPEPTPAPEPTPSPRGGDRPRRAHRITPTPRQTVGAFFVQADRKNRIKNTPQRLTHELPWGLLLFTDSEKSATHMCLTHPNSFSVCDEFKQAIFLRIIGRHQPRPCPLQSCRLWSRWHCSS